MRLTPSLAVLLAACAGDVPTRTDTQPASVFDSGPSSEDELDGGSRDHDDGGDDDSPRDASSHARDAGHTAPRDAGVDAALPPGPCSAGNESLVETLSITELSLYQAVKIPLFAEEEWVTDRPAPVVQNKQALVRLFIKPLTGYAPHEVLGILTLTNGSEMTMLEAKLTPRSASVESDLESTFNFSVPAAALGTNTEISASVVEVKCDPKRKPNLRARTPSSGSEPLDATEIGTLRLVLVPVRVGNFVPDTSATLVDGLRSAFLAHYPVPKVDVSLAPMMSWNYAVTSSGQGWSELLAAITRQRQNDDVEDDVYYLGLVAPARRRSDFCTGGCVSGLAPLNITASTGDQVGLSLGFGGESTYSSAVHEIGHAHGRPHAPCGGAAGPDRKYPYPGGDIGSWGWDSRSQELIPPDVKDFMGYCEPQWISDYNYAALADRALSVNTTPLIVKSNEPSSVDSAWVRLIIYADHQARWAGLTKREAPNGAREPLRVFDAHGALLAELEASRTRLDHSSESFVDIPEPRASWSTIELAGVRLSLASVLPAR
ncbi:MAG: M66 family metalloprotease [Myxococcales bacterium]